MVVGKLQKMKINETISIPPTILFIKIFHSNHLTTSIDLQFAIHKKNYYKLFVSPKKAYLSLGKQSTILIDDAARVRNAKREINKFINFINNLN
jgi:hypothetical protein